MKIIYHCFGGTHSSVTAAAAHLGNLPADRLPKPEELQSIPFFDNLDGRNHGKITLMGIDRAGNEVYFAGQRGKPHILENVIHGLAKHFQIPAESYRLVNVMHKVNISMRLGGVMSRKLKWIAAGRPLVTIGTIWAYPEILHLVRNTLVKENSW